MGDSRNELLLRCQTLVLRVSIRSPAKDYTVPVVINLGRSLAPQICSGDLRYWDFKCGYRRQICTGPNRAAEMPQTVFRNTI